jgi:hypothetical protein
MDVRDVFIDGIEQANEWIDEALTGLAAGQVNWLPGGNALTIGWNAWHYYRTCDNVTNFVLKNRTPTIWIEKGYVERFGLPKVAQGTGMSLDEAQALAINDPALLLEYGHEVHGSVVEYLRNVPPETLDEIIEIKPLGVHPRGRIIRQVLMTHGFLHLGEMNTIRGILGISTPR